MTKFLTFANPTYYPSGGMSDCVGVFDTLAEAEAAMRTVLSNGVSEGHILQVPELIVHDYESDGTIWLVAPLNRYINGG